MRIREYVIGGAVCVSVLLAVAATEDHQPAEALTYAVKVQVDDATGSGVVIGNARYATLGKPATHSLILTCYHVVSDDDTGEAATDVKIVRNNKEYAGRVVAANKELDLALIDVGEHWKPARIYTGKIRQGEQEIVVGYPVNTHLSLTSGYFGETDSDGTRQGTASVWPGNSGGAVFVNRGGWQVAGIAKSVSQRAFSALPQLLDNVSYFIPAASVAKFLKDSHV